MTALVAACGKSEEQPKTAAQPAKTESANAPAATTAQTPEASGLAAPAPLKSLGVSELLKRAGTALAESRFVQPPGNNAAEYYLAVLDKDSNNVAARDGLREMFPMATGAIEQEINAGQLEEGKRAIDLMGRADANNYALTILRGKLDLKRKQLDGEKDKLQRDQDKALAAAKAAAASAPATAAAPAGSPPAAVTPPPPSAPGPAPVQQAPAAAPVAAAAAPAPAPAQAAAPAGSNRDATLVTRVSPVYPNDAARNHQEGWVEVSFVVSADGKVRDASVVNATPARVFNAAALRAVQSWTFQPRIENGKPAEQTVRTRIEFRL
ncbi:MAG: energy transducer TonB [Rudaea sp.]